METTSKVIPSSFYEREDTPRIARELLGKLLVVPDPNGKRVSGMIVETEAYLGVTDKAAHSYGGKRTDRTNIMFGDGGNVYTFLVYGMHYQLNFVTGPVDHPHAILIRAVEPVDGIELMRKRRGKMPDKNLTSGPGKLCKAFAIDKSYNGLNLTQDTIWVEEYTQIPTDDVLTGARIGVDYAGEDAKKPWRYWVKGNPFISR